LGLGQGRVGRHFWHLFLTQMVRKAIQSSTWQSAFSRWGRVLVCWAALGLAQATWADTVNAGRREAASAGSPCHDRNAGHVFGCRRDADALACCFGCHQDKAVLLRSTCCSPCCSNFRAVPRHTDRRPGYHADTPLPGSAGVFGVPVCGSGCGCRCLCGIPEEIDNLSADLTEEAPGFWAHRQRDKTRTLYLHAQPAYRCAGHQCVRIASRSAWSPHELAL
jgi:hypothetical protein